MNIVRYLRQRLKTLRGMTVVHVGAHRGQELDRYTSMFARKVIWIEANPSTFKILQKRIEEYRNRRPGLWHRWLGIAPTEHICINALITDQDGVEHRFFHFNNAGASDSIFHLASATSFPNLQETGTVSRLVSCRLDTALEMAGQDPRDVDVLVLDTQGAEMLVLKGAGSTLASCRFIEAEISTKPVYEGGVLFDELNLWLQERGFKRKTLIRRPHMNVIYQSQGLKAAA